MKTKKLQRLRSKKCLNKNISKVVDLALKDDKYSKESLKKLCDKIIKEAQKAAERLFPFKID